MSSDIPGLAEALATATGSKLEVTMEAASSMAVIDHWTFGLAPEKIAEGGWEWVVLQQGPSSLELGRDTLRLATRLFAEKIARVHARTALFSTWPAEDRRMDFARAIESYTLAASDVDGILLPVAAAWLAAWRHDATLDLYSTPTYASDEGAYLSALVVYGRLLGKSPRGLPSDVTTRNGFSVSIAPARAVVLQDAAAEVLGMF